MILVSVTKMEWLIQLGTMKHNASIDVMCFEDFCTTGLHTMNAHVITDTFYFLLLYWGQCP